jgi:dTDP-4-dehydrorhamnose reductase
LAPTTAAGSGFNIQQIDARRVALNRAAARPPVRVLSSNRVFTGMSANAYSEKDESGRRLPGVPIRANSSLSDGL